jgi:prepilin-type N-terminal cleavage/methylation domain-containing protein
MMISNNNPGFTLQEVLIALAIAGMLLVPLLSRQTTILFSVLRACSTLYGAVIAENTVLRHGVGVVADEHEKNLQESESLVVQYKQESVSAASSLQSMKDLVKHSATVEQQNASGMHAQTMLCFWYNPEGSSHAH